MNLPEFTANATRAAEQLREFTANATRAAEQLREQAALHPEWEAVKSGDGLYYIFDRSDKMRGYVSFTEGRVVIHPQEAKRGKA